MSQKRELLSAARIKKGLSRQQLAEVAGVTFEHIRSLEYGRSNPSATMMLKLCQILERPPEEIFEDMVERT